MEIGCGRFTLDKAILDERRKLTANASPALVGHAKFKRVLLEPFGYGREIKRAVERLVSCFADGYRILA